MKSCGKIVEEERRKPVLFYMLMITTTIAGTLDIYTGEKYVSCGLVFRYFI